MTRDEFVAFGCLGMSLCFALLGALVPVLAWPGCWACFLCACVGLARPVRRAYGKDLTEEQA